MVYRFMQENQGRYTIREMAGVCGVSCSAYYKWAKKEAAASGREEEDAELVRLIREIVEQHHWRYGSPRVRETLRRDYGKRVSRKKVAVAASLPLDAGKWLKRPATAEIHPHDQLAPRAAGL
jgi:hypothetical protein